MDILVGLQFGDEAKGRIIDYITKNCYSAVARWAGGANCGHSIVVNGDKIVLHLLPSAVLHPQVNLYMGSQMVICPDTLLQEIQDLENRGLRIRHRLFIAHNAHLVLPKHKILDAERESGLNPIGTTKKGIGPAYEDKVARRGARMEDLAMYGYSSLSQCVYNDIPERIENEANVLFEGAQGTFLDIDHGTYPYFTSSNTIAASACVSFGVAPWKIRQVIGVTKAYCTRVGNGPFDTELTNSVGEHIRNVGQEYGSTTGRPRRCGWLDADILKKAVLINGITRLALTKLDVLTGLPHISIKCNNGGLLTLPGWTEDISWCRNYYDLPDNARDYIDKIESVIGENQGFIEFISVGPERDQMIIR